MTIKKLLLLVATALVFLVAVVYDAVAFHGSAAFLLGAAAEASVLIFTFTIMGVRIK